MGLPVGQQFYKPFSGKEVHYEKKCLLLEHNDNLNRLMRSDWNIPCISTQDSVG